jgi:mycothiol synthase
MKTLPDGYRARPMRREDAEKAVDMFNAYTQRLWGVSMESVEEDLAMWSQPKFNMETDTLLVLSPEGEVAGYAELWDIVEPHVRPFGWARTHPDHFGRGIGTHIEAWAVQRAQQVIERAPDGARVCLLQSVPSVDQVGRAFLGEKGYTETRHFYHMRVEFNEPPQPPVLPEGVTIRSMAEGEERAFLHTSWEAFKDHWGVVPSPFESYFESWMERIKNDPDFDRSLWFGAWDGEQVAGMCFNKGHTTEDPEMAWVNTLGVRREWRHKGLGLALLLHSFGEFHRRGKRKAGLGVDSSSLTGATRLYEKAGMRVFREFVQFEKELRPGQELSTQSI